jgi:5-methyltetrahydrofolate--homocysteine methyltransferase
MGSILENIASHLYAGEDEDVGRLVRAALDEGIAPQEVLSDGLIAGMDQVGRSFKCGDMFVPEVLASARAMAAGMQVLRPLLTSAGVQTVGTCVIGTVEGDLHDIGKNLVKMMLEGAGFEIVDLGVNVKPDAFVAAVQQHQARLLAMSALLTTTMPKMKATLDALQEAGIRDQVFVIVGGAPVTSDYAKQIGADGFGRDSAVAVDVARRLVAQAA